MMKRCCICGCTFETNRTDRKTCGDIDCKHIQHMEYLRKYAAERREAHRDEINDNNRLWMREYRAKQKADKEMRLASINSFEGLDYAEHQKQKTLEMAGKIRTAL